MGIHTAQSDVVPVAALSAGNDADGFGLYFEHRTLFDVKLVIGLHYRFPAWSFTQVTNGFQFITDRQTCRVTTGMSVFEVKDPGPDARADHCRRESCSFLVGPADDLNGSLCSEIKVVECADDLKASEDPVDTIESATGRLSIKVTTRHDRRQVRTVTVPPGEYVAHLVYFDRTP